MLKTSAKSRAKINGLTFEYAHSILRYDPETGKLFWKIGGHKRSVGKEVGTRTCYGYIQVRIDYFLYKAHHIIWLLMTGGFPQHQIDHVNGEGTNNRWCNLREATASQNAANSAVQRRRKSSQYKGVNFRNGHWRAYIKQDGLVKQIGVFNTESEAALAYNLEATKLFGEFARLNSVDAQ